MDRASRRCVAERPRRGDRSVDPSRPVHSGDPFVGEPAPRRSAVRPLAAPDVAAKLTAPLGRNDPPVRAAVDGSTPAFDRRTSTTACRPQRVRGRLFSGTCSARSQQLGQPMTVDLRVGWFDREFLRGSLSQPPPPFGPFPSSTLHFLAEDLARAGTRRRMRRSGFTRHSSASIRRGGCRVLSVGRVTRRDHLEPVPELRTQLDVTWGRPGMRISTWRRVRRAARRDVSAGQGLPPGRSQRTDTVRADGSDFAA